jgi:hypothetical protein
MVPCRPARSIAAVRFDTRTHSIAVRAPTFRFGTPRSACMRGSRHKEVVMVAGGGSAHRAATGIC